MTDNTQDRARLARAAGTLAAHGMTGVADQVRRAADTLAPAETTPGEVAREGYGFTLPWDNLARSVRDRWEQAARAVIEHHEGRTTTTAPVAED